MGSEIWKPNLLKSWQMAAIFSKNHLKSGQKLSDFEWSGFQMVGAVAIAKPWPFEIWPSKVWISDSHCGTLKLNLKADIHLHFDPQCWTILVHLRNWKTRLELFIIDGSKSLYKRRFISALKDHLDMLLDPQYWISKFMFELNIELSTWAFLINCFDKINPQRNIDIPFQYCAQSLILKVQCWAQSAMLKFNVKNPKQIGQKDEMQRGRSGLQWGLEFRMR